jgi:hypothetical protein
MGFHRHHIDEVGNIEEGVGSAIEAIASGELLLRTQYCTTQARLPIRKFHNLTRQCQSLR